MNTCAEYVEANLSAFLRNCPGWTESEARSELRSIYRECCQIGGIEVTDALPPTGADLDDWLRDVVEASDYA